MRNPKMKRRDTADPKANGLRLLFMCGLGLCLATFATPVQCFAQDGVQASIMQVADVTLLPLPNSMISTIKGTGLQGPSLNRSSTPMGTITLWDELKPAAQQENMLSGTQVITINGTTR